MNIETNISKNQYNPNTSSYEGSSYWSLVKKYGSKFLKWLSRDNNWKWVFVTLTLSGIIHILAVFSLPHVVQQSGWSRLSEMPLNQMQFLDKLENKVAPLEMLAPDISYAICRYDVSLGPVSVISDVPNDLFSIGVYDTLGQNFYILFGANIQREKLNVILVNKKDLDDMQAAVAEGSDDIILVEVPENQGVVLLRAPVRGPAYEQTIETILSKATCQRK